MLQKFYLLDNTSSPQLFILKTLILKKSKLLQNNLQIKFNFLHTQYFHPYLSKIFQFHFNPHSTVAPKGNHLPLHYHLQSEMVPEHVLELTLDLWFSAVAAVAFLLPSWLVLVSCPLPTHSWANLQQPTFVKEWTSCPPEESQCEVSLQVHLGKWLWQQVFPPMEQTPWSWILRLKEWTWQQL